MSKYNKILFLDIDGVLNSGDNMVSLHTNRQIGLIDDVRDEFGYFFDDRCVRHLRWVEHETKCKFVISSTWRKDGLEVMQNLWTKRNLPGEVIDITPTRVSQYVINMYGIINDEGDRGFEIQEWLEENNWDKYCIADDDGDMLNHQMGQFVKVNNKVGLDYFSAMKIINVLNDEL